MYRVTITQTLQYRDDLVAEFANLTEAWSFVAIAMGHCKSITVTVEKVEVVTLADMNGNVRAEKEVEN